MAAIWDHHVAPRARKWGGDRRRRCRYGIRESCFKNHRDNVNNVDPATVFLHIANNNKPDNNHIIHDLPRPSASIFSHLWQHGKHH